MGDAAYRNSGAPDDLSGTQNTADGAYDNDTINSGSAGNTPSENQNFYNAEISGENEVSETPEQNIADFSEDEFELKDKNSYIQLRLIVTSKENETDKAATYLQKKIDGELVYSTGDETVLSTPKEHYDIVLNAIIDCPYTENVIYRNEDYYPVVQEMAGIFNSEEKVSEETKKMIQGIERMCQKVMVVISDKT